MMMLYVYRCRMWTDTIRKLFVFLYLIGLLLFDVTYQ